MGLYRRVTNVVRRVATVGVNGPHELSVNPISFMTLHLDGVVAGAAAVGQDQPFTDLTNITVTFNGASVINLNAVDLRAALVALGWRVPYVVNHPSVTNGDLVRVSIPIPFSRKRFWLREGFPASRKGELQMTLTFATEGATFQTRNYTLESTEVLDMRSERFLKMVSNSRALTAGDPDFELPIGNDYVGVLIFEPTLADAGVATGTVAAVRLLLDNVEFGIANARYEALRDYLEQKGSPIDGFANGALPNLANYAYVDLDPLADDSYLLPTIGRSSVKLRFEVDNAGTLRVVPIELVKVETAATGVPVMG